MYLGLFQLFIVTTSLLAGKFLFYMPSHKDDNCFRFNMLNVFVLERLEVMDSETGKSSIPFILRP